MAERSPRAAAPEQPVAVGGRVARARRRGAARAPYPARDNGAVSEPGEAVPVIRPVGGGTAKLMPDVDADRGWLLTVDGAPQSYVDLDDPDHLEFEYVRRLAHLVDLAGPDGAPLDVLHLGGGALTLPRYVAAARPGSRQDVVEADGALIAMVRAHLPLPPGSGVAVHHADARTWLAAAPDRSADVVVGDVFGGARVPAHLTSVEYAREAARVVRADGLYAANLADGAPFAFLRPQLATFASVFAEVALVAEPAVLRGRRFGNTVLVASHRPVDVVALAGRTAGDPFPARVEHGSALRRLVGDARPVHDTDAVPSPRPPDDAFTLG